MRRFAIIPTIVLAALLGFSFVAAQSGSTTPIPYIYRIDIKGCKFEPAIRRQTGFRVQGIAGVVTALHGVADCTTIHAIADGGQEIFTDLTIQQVDIAHDVALLASAQLNELPADGLMASPLSSTEILSATLRIVGYPRGLEKQDVDVIESIRDIESLDDVIPDAEEPADFIKRKSPSLTIDVLNVQAQLLPGHSGAPLLDSEERIVAIGNGGLRSGSDGRSWAIPWNADGLQSIGVADVKEKLDELANKDIAALAFSSTYPNQIDATITSKSYTIQIVDAAKNQPIANAAVLLTHNAGYESGVTDSEGFHIFHLLTDGTINYAESQIQVEAVGYESYIRNVPNVQKRASPEKVQLIALRLCSFAFLVLDDQSEEPIRKATIAVFVGVKQDIGTTDSTGYYLAKLPCSNGQEVEARVRVSVDGYDPYNRSVFLSGETIEILLEPKIKDKKTKEAEGEIEQLTSFSRELVAQSTTAFNNSNYELAFLLAIEAGRRADTLQAFTELYKQLPIRGRLLATLPSKIGAIYGAKWNQTGTLILVWGGDNLAELWHFTGRQPLFTFTHEGSVNGAEWNYDESRILTWSFDNTAKVWDTATGKQQLTLAHESEMGVNGAIWSKDASRILTWSEKAVRIWDATNGNQLFYYSQDGVRGAKWDISEKRILSWGLDAVKMWDITTGEQLFETADQGAKWNHDESRILTWSSGLNGGIGINLWDISDGAKLLAIESSAMQAQWNEDESRILSWDLWDTASEWDSNTGQKLLMLPNTDSLRGNKGAKWNSNNTRVVTWSLEWSPIVWNATNGGQLFTLPHEGYVLDAQWSQDNNHILTSSLDGTAKIWDAETGQLSVLIPNGGVVSAQWNADESRIVTWNGDIIKIWDVANTNPLATLLHEGPITGARWNKSESQILTWSEDSTTRVWDAASGKEQISMNHDGIVGIAAWNRDESRIVTWDGATKVWDADNGKQLLTITQGSIPQWSRDGSRILTLGNDNTINIWDAISGLQLLIINCDSNINGASWNNNGSQILTWDGDNAKVWDATTGKQILAMHHDTISGALWNKNENRILTWGWDKTARIWDATTGVPLFTITQQYEIEGAQWSSDVSQILTWGLPWGGENTATVWDITTGKKLLSVAHDNIFGAQWSHDGNYILTWRNIVQQGVTTAFLSDDTDDAVRIWDAKDGELLRSLPADGPFVWEAQWNHDDSQIMFTITTKDSKLGKVYRYYTRISDLIDLACEQATRNLTWTEWQEYLPDELYKPTCPNLPSDNNVPPEKIIG